MFQPAKSTVDKYLNKKYGTINPFTDDSQYAEFGRKLERDNPELFRLMVFTQEITDKIINRKGWVKDRLF